VGKGKGKKKKKTGAKLFPDLRILGPVLKNDYFNKVEEILDELLDEVLKTGYLRVIE
jgi:hypothetical protein